MSIIEDGATGSVCQVKNNRMQVDAVVETEAHNATEHGRSYNLNTGLITLTSGTESAVMYVKNTDPTKSLFIEAIAVGVGPSTGGVSTEAPIVTVIRNPTTGTIIESTPTDVDISSNRNFSSSNSIIVDAYKGSEGETLTDGTDHILFQVNAGSRLFATIDADLLNGASIGIKIDPQASNTNMQVYVALICYVEDIV